jgi:SAM-dependent methyltransferase
MASQSTSAASADAFREFEHSQWQAAVEPYDRAWGSLTRQTIPMLLEAIRVAEGTRMLDVACGPGHVAAAASASGASVVGLDFAGAMVARASALHPGIDFREGDAEDLPFPDRSFDAVGMNFGMLHLSRPDQAIHEAFRVLRSGGRFAFTVWATPEHAAAFALVLRTLKDHGQPVELPAGPDFFRYSQPATCIEALGHAGFQDVDTRVLALTWRLSAPSDLFWAFHAGTARTGALLRGQPQTTRATIEETLEAATVAFQRPDGQVELPMAAILAWGARPLEDRYTLGSSATAWSMRDWGSSRSSSVPDRYAS